MSDDRPDRLTFEISPDDLGWIIAALHRYHDQARSDPDDFPFRFHKPENLAQIRDLWRRMQERIDIHRGHHDHRCDAVAFWVTRLKFSEARGRIILEGESFHQDLAWLPEPGPARLFAWKGGERILIDGANAAHVHRFGASWAWEVIGSERFPEPPFLLTDQSTCRPQYRGPVNVLLATWADPDRVESFDSWMNSRGWFETPLIGDGWFGWLRIEAEDRSRGWLEAFTKEDITLSPGDEITARWLLEDGEFGRLRIESPR